MTIETATYIASLVAANPAGGDAKNEGDNHIRLIKAALLATLPNFTGAAKGSHLDVLKNHWTGGAAPAVTDDSADGFSIGSYWLDSLGNLYIATDVTVGAAVWSRLANNVSSGGYRNKIINGAFQVNQRDGTGTGATLTAGAAYRWCADRWYAFCSGASVFLDNTAGSSFPYYTVEFQGAVGCTGIGIGTRLEGDITRDLKSSAATLSITADASGGPHTITWSIYSANVLDTFGSRASPARTLIDTGTWSVTGTTPTRYSAVITDMGTNVHKGVEIVLTAGAFGSGKTFRMYNIQLEKGAVATDYEVVPLDLNLYRCQRYYEIGNYAQTLPVSNASVTTSYLSPVYFKATKRVAPTVTGTNTQGGTFSALSINTDGCSIGRSDAIANRINSGTYIADSEMTA